MYGGNRILDVKTFGDFDFQLNTRQTSRYVVIDIVQDRICNRQITAQPTANPTQIPTQITTKSPTGYLNELGDESESIRPKQIIYILKMSKENKLLHANESAIQTHGDLILETNMTISDNVYMDHYDNYYGNDNCRKVMNGATLDELHMNIGRHYNDCNACIIYIMIFLLFITLKYLHSIELIVFMSILLGGQILPHCMAAITLDPRGNPAEFYVEAYASAGYYRWVEGQHNRGHPFYFHRNSLGHPRYLYVANSYGTWELSWEREASGIYAGCNIYNRYYSWYNLYKTDYYPEVIPCIAGDESAAVTSSITIKFCVLAPDSDGKYFFAELFNDKWVYTNDDNTRFIYYHNGGWKVSDSIGNDVFYGECDKEIFYECSMPEATIDVYPCETLQPTTVTITPTVAPTMKPTLPTASPTASPSIAPSFAKGYPTMQPTLTQKYIYVRKSGCDFGYCSSNATNYTDTCLHIDENLIGNLHESETFCCDVETTTGNPTHPVRRRNLFEATTLEPTLEPTVQPTYIPTLEPTTSSPTLDPSIVQCGDLVSGSVTYDDYWDDIPQYHPFELTFFASSVTIDACNNNWDTYLWIEDNSGNIISENDDAYGCGLQSRLELTNLKPGTYQIVMLADYGDYGDYSFDILCESLSPTDSTTIAPTGSAPFTLPPTSLPTVSPTIGKLNCGDHISGTTTVTGDKKSYILSLPLSAVTRTVTIDVCNANWNTHLYLYNSTGYLIAENDDACDYQSKLDVHYINGGDYRIEIAANYYDSHGNFSLQITCDISSLEPSKSPTSTTISPSTTPTVEPTSIPTEQPTLPSSTPTKTPTLHVAYKPTCATIPYSWACFLGHDVGYPHPTGCKLAGYDGNGIFDLGEGNWEFAYPIRFADNNVIIRGQGASLTTLNYTGNDPIWIQCIWTKCWISLQHLTIASNRIDDNYLQFYMPQGGTLLISNVVFDGENYQMNTNADPLWKFSDSRVKVIFEYCYFTKNTVTYQFLNGTHAEFISCIFEENIIHNIAPDSTNT
eukprot:475107_1